MQIQLRPAADQTPRRAIAPGTSSRYQEKSSPPPDWCVDQRVRAQRLDGMGEDAGGEVLKR